MLKYIKTGDGQFVLFEQERMHSAVAHSLLIDPISAGFIYPMPDGVLRCVGGSITLGLASLPEDTKQLREWLS